jgi:hypothetical protein
MDTLERSGEKMHTALGIKCTPDVANLRNLAKELLAVDLPSDEFLADLLEHWSTDAILAAAAMIFEMLSDRDFVPEFEKYAKSTLIFFALVDVPKTQSLSTAIMCFNRRVDLDCYRHLLTPESAERLQEYLSSLPADTGLDVSERL